MELTPKYRRFIAAIGAVFAILATTALIVYFFKPDLWGGAVGIIAIFCYIITVGIFLLIRLNDKKMNERENERFKYIPSDDADEGTKTEDNVDNSTANNEENNKDDGSDK